MELVKFDTGCGRIITLHGGDHPDSDFNIRIEDTYNDRDVPSFVSREDARKLRDALNAALGDVTPAAPVVPTPSALPVRDGDFAKEDVYGATAALFDGADNTVEVTFGKSDPKPYWIDATTAREFAEWIIRNVRQDDEGPYTQTFTSDMGTDFIVGRDEDGDVYIDNDYESFCVSPETARKLTQALLRVAG